MKKQYLLMILIFFLFLGCSITKLHQEGTVAPVDFYSKFSFETYKGVIGFNVDIDGETKFFLFDTGADLSLIQRDSIIGKKDNFSGASKRKMELGRELITSIRIENIDFKNTHALNGDMIGLKEQIPNFGGLIGQPIIHKANWLIDYPNKQIELSSRELGDKSFKEIELVRENGNNPYTFLEMNGKKYKVVIDFGSSSIINLPTGSQFAKDVIKSIKLSKNTRKRYTLGGLQQIQEKVGIIPEIKLGEFEFKNVDVNINNSSQPRIGIKFFKDFKIYIDNSNENIKLKENIKD